MTVTYVDMDIDGSFVNFADGPLTVDPPTNYYEGAIDHGYSTSDFQAGCADRGCFSVSTAGDNLEYGWLDAGGGNMYARQVFVSFATGAIPDGDIVTAAVLNFYISGVTGTCSSMEIGFYSYGTLDCSDQDITTSGSDPQSFASSTGWKQCTFSNMGLVNKTGDTQFRTNVGCNCASGQEHIGHIWSQGTSHPNDPYLDVTHGAAFKGAGVSVMMF